MVICHKITQMSIFALDKLSYEYYNGIVTVLVRVRMNVDTFIIVLCRVLVNKKIINY